MPASVTSVMAPSVVAANVTVPLEPVRALSFASRNCTVNALVAAPLAVIDGALRLTVADHGPGVDPTDRGRLFGRYERGGRGGSSGGDGGGEGSGLGLYVSRALCLAMGGDLVLEPQAPDRGAAFTVILAAEHAEEG